MALNPNSKHVPLDVDEHVKLKHKKVTEYYNNMLNNFCK